MLPLSPSKLGRYEIVEEIGKGAMGVVYLARDPLIGRLVALKTFRVGFSVKDAELEQFRARFIREAQSAGILSHPNIVTIHDVVERGEDGLAFIAMEYVRGTNLKSVLQEPQRPTLTYVVEVLTQIADGLDYAHSCKVIHRDIKPANILITAEARAKITDFGIARLDTSNLTQEGQLLGTPNYMSPEQIIGRDVDYRADIFSLGVVLYEMITRHKPFQGDNLTMVSHRIVYDHFTPPREYVDDLPPGTEQILAKALEKDPARRYQRARDMADDLRRVVGSVGVRDMLNETQSLSMTAALPASLLRSLPPAAAEPSLVPFASTTPLPAGVALPPPGAGAPVSLVPPAPTAPMAPLAPMAPMDPPSPLAAAPPPPPLPTAAAVPAGEGTGIAGAAAAVSVAPVRAESGPRRSVWQRLSGRGGAASAGAPAKGAPGPVAVAQAPPASVAGAMPMPAQDGRADASSDGLVAPGASPASSMLPTMALPVVPLGQGAAPVAAPRPHRVPPGQGQPGGPRPVAAVAQGAGANHAAPEGGDTAATQPPAGGGAASTAPGPTGYRHATRPVDQPGDLSPASPAQVVLQPDAPTAPLPLGQFQTGASRGASSPAASHSGMAASEAASRAAVAVPAAAVAASFPPSTAGSSSSASSASSATGGHAPGLPVSVPPPLAGVPSAPPDGGGAASLPAVAGQMPVSAVAPVAGPVPGKATKVPGRRGFFGLPSLVGTIVAVVLGVVLAALAVGGVVAWLRAQQPAVLPTRQAAALVDAQRTQLLTLMRDGRQRLEAGDAAGAVAAFRAAELLAPGRRGPTKLREAAEQQAGDVQRRLGQEHDIETRLAAGRQALTERRYDDAEAAAQAVLQQSPGNTVADEILTAVKKGRARQAGRLLAAQQSANPVVPLPAARPLVAPVAAPVPAPVAEAKEATLELGFFSKLPEGSLLIYINGRKVLQESFRFYEKGGIFRSHASTGWVRRSFHLAAGSAEVRVYVTAQGKAAQVKTLSGNFPGGAARRLDVQLTEDGQVTAQLN